MIGGGVAGAKDLIIPSMLEEMRSQYKNFEKETYNRLAQRVFNLENEMELNQFIKGENRKIKVPKSEKYVSYDSMQRIGVGFSKMGTSTAVAVGAYAFALNELDKNS